MAEENKQPEFVKVADVWMVKNDDQFVGLEMTFTQNVYNKDGAMTVIDFMKNSILNTRWLFATINRVEDKDAPTNAQPESDGSESPKAPPPSDATRESAKGDS